MTIDVADLRKRAERTFPQVYPSELTELLDAYEELHRYDADMEAGGDWLPLHLREAVAGSDPEQRAVVTEWYWRTNLLIGGLQTERDRLRAACSHEFVPDGWVVTDSWLDVATGMAIPNAWQPTHYRCKKCLARVSVAALEGRK